MFNKNINYFLLVSIPIIIILGDINVIIGNLFSIIITFLCLITMFVYLIKLNRNKKDRLRIFHMIKANRNKILLAFVIIFTIILSLAFIEVLSNKFHFNYDNLRELARTIHIIYIICYIVFLIYIWINIYYDKIDNI